MEKADREIARAIQELEAYFLSTSTDADDPKLIVRYETVARALRVQLQSLRREWRRVAQSGNRKAIGRYLAAAYKRGRSWQRRDLTEFAIDIAGCGDRLLVDSSFRAALLCGAMEGQGQYDADPKTIEKWGRVLEIADHLGIEVTNLRAFIADQGGINRVLAAYRDLVPRPLRRRLINRRLSQAEVLECQGWRRSADALAARFLAG